MDDVERALANLESELHADERADARALYNALSAVADDACSYICPSTGTVGVPIPHSERCIAIRKALADYEDAHFLESEPRNLGASP